MTAEGKDAGQWQHLDSSGLLLQVAGGTGPPVMIRLVVRGALVQANLNADPWGRVRLDERDLGPTPLGQVPLRPGLRRLQVQGPEGGTTRFELEIEK